ncbi:major facilitator superfamily MFS_1 [Paenibacillus algicola]|uniref:Major facilitator superfamily MFS_1 n=1 Tax=Paenibacillus algicola TaxID=2565926 RepID=A0A4P8XF64_9BACL|nr:MFS transporter [Paenibacillus algicola]QCT00996.1 major facilitator superfamily MFS_1 [Paenibacillus algicola]
MNSSSNPAALPASKAGTPSSRWALFALAVSAFGIGTTEFVPVGLLSSIADDMSIRITLAGLLISIYAVGVAAGAPVLTALTNRMSRKSLLLSLMVLFIVGNTAAALSQSFALLLTARVVTAFAHGVFFSIGSTIAVQLVPAEKKASAIALMFTGLTVATVTGVPLGTYIGQGFGWRATFAGVAGLGVIALLALSVLIPKNLKQPPPAKFQDMLRLLTHPSILTGLGMTALGYGGTFVAFTYLTPMLQDVVGLKPSAVGIVLLIYGLAVAAGNEIGGRWANRNPVSALRYMFIIQAAVLILMSLVIPFRVAGLAAVILMGLFAFMNVPGLQLYTVQMAEKYVPSAVDVASALNIAAFNVGIALGATIGGIAVDTIGIRHTPWIGSLMVLAAAALAIHATRQSAKR